MEKFWNILKLNKRITTADQYDAIRLSFVFQMLSMLLPFVILLFGSWQKVVKPTLGSYQENSQNETSNVFEQNVAR